MFSTRMGRSLCKGTIRDNNSVVRQNESPERATKFWLTYRCLRRRMKSLRKSPKRMRRGDSTSLFITSCGSVLARRAGIGGRGGVGEEGSLLHRLRLVSASKGRVWSSESARSRLRLFVVCKSKAVVTHLIARPRHGEQKMEPRRVRLGQQSLQMDHTVIL